MKKGDVVKLKSGGPLMTIQDIDHWGMVYSGMNSYPKDQAQCYWFDGNEMKEGIFNLESLLLIENVTN